MSHMVLKVDFLPGTSFCTAVKEAREKAAELGLAYINFTFNRVDVYVLPEGHSEALDLGHAEERYRRAKAGDVIFV